VDATFIEGVAAVVAGIAIFCGSVFLVLTFVMGAKLAYFVTASVTLAFVLIMGLVWTFSDPTAPLGPVGEPAKWTAVSAAEEGDELNGPSASEYPESPWEPVDEEDQSALTQSTELQTDGLDYIVAEVDTGNLPNEVSENYLADSESVRFLQEGDTQYGAVTFDAPTGEKGPSVVALMEYDAGDPLLDARMITGGTFALLVGHLIFLSLAERRARRSREEAPAT
jgi:hypothetical protein